MANGDPLSVLSSIPAAAGRVALGVGTLGLSELALRKKQQEQAAMRAQQQQAILQQQAFANIFGGMPQPGQQANPAQQRLRQLALATAQEIPGAQFAFEQEIGGRISPEEERRFAIEERGVGVRERAQSLEGQRFDLEKKKFDQSVKEFDRKLKEGPLGPQDKLKAERDVRKEFTGLSKAFIDQRDAFSRVQASAEDPSAAGDIALIFNFMKILDPGSVVREGEFATAQNSGGVPDTVRALYNKTISGQRLTPKIRGDFLNRSEKLFSKAEAQHGKRVEQFTGLADRAGLDVRNIILDLGLAESPEPTQPQRPIQDLSIEELQAIISGGQ